MSSEGNPSRATDGDVSGRAAATTSGARAVVRTADSMPGDSMAMGAADTHVAAAAVASAAPTSPAVDVRAATAEPTIDESVRDSHAETVTRDPTGGVATTREKAAHEPDPLLSEVLLDRYEITEKIGQGGMGAVYEARHTKIGKRVAVKVLLAKYLDRDQVVARLEQEARLASSIGHEHIIDITDFGETPDGRTFVVMEFLDGESLGACIQRDGPLPEQRVIRIAQQVAGALHAAHEKGIIHRDIKPENVFLLERKNHDFVKVVDFGISKSLAPEDEGGNSPRLTQTGMVLGTPLYMSPEQARGSEKLDRRIDVYSLGVIMYEMITGEVPFHGSNYLSIISQVLNEEPQHPSEMRADISRDFEDVILRALAKDPEERYQSCEDLANDLTMLIADPGRTTMRGRVSASKYRRKRERRSGLNMLGWAAGIAVIISAVVVSVVMLMGNADQRDSERKERPVTIIALPAADAAVAPTVDAAPAVPDSALVEVHFVSSPMGAHVFRGSRDIGVTPFSYQFVKKDEKIQLVASLDGHNDAEFEINPLTDNLEQLKKPVSFKLDKPAAGTKRRRIPKKPSNGKRPKDGAGSQTGTNDGTSTDKKNNGTETVPEGLKKNPFGQDGQKNSSKVRRTVGAD